ncbi:MAG: sigma-70 family RNA polymerase sigma factor [Gemmatimonadota bacterium]
MIAANVGLVHHFANRLARSAPAAELGDLVGGGMIGLIQAVDSYDPGHNVAFSTFAAPRIRGAMLDDLRRCDHATRASRRRQRDVQRTEQVLNGRLVRTPRHGEVAEELGVCAETLWEWKHSGAAAVHVSLECDGGRGVLEEVPGGGAEDVEAPVERREQLDWLSDRMSALEERDRMVLALYYAQGLKLREIAEVLGVTESRVSQIRTAVLARLKAEWQAEAA